jgi:hypothetical protein
MKSDHDPLASRALSALADQCEIPADLEDRILSAVLECAAPPAPVVPLPRAEPPPFQEVIRLSRRDQRFWRWTGRAAVAATLALLALVVAYRPTAPHRGPAPPLALSPAFARPPAGLRGERAPDGHPRLEEARVVMFRLAGRVAAECHVAWWSADVLYEKTGRATVLGVSSSGADDRACVGKVVATARVQPANGARLAVHIESSAAGGGPRIVGWVVDES